MNGWKTRVMLFDKKEKRMIPTFPLYKSDFYSCKTERFLLLFSPGQTDKTGAQIYQGDILQSFVDPEIKLKHVVEWSDKYLGWYLWNIKDVNRIGDGSIQAFVYFKNRGKDCEIIGNIHTNPELLTADI